MAFTKYDFFAVRFVNFSIAEEAFIGGESYEV